MSSIRQQHTRFKERAAVANQPENTPNPSAPSASYTQLLADTLEANRMEQQEITTQVARLQDRLGQLRADETHLDRILQAAQPTPDGPAETGPAAGDTETQPVPENEQPDPASSTPAPAETAAEAPRAVPRPRQTEHAGTSTPATRKQAKTTAKKKATGTKPAAKKASGKKTAQAKKTAPAKKTTAEKDAPRKQVQPSLPQLVLALLLKAPGEPHQAREIFDSLGKAHPGRAASVQVVRNSLDSLARKKTIEKTQQGNSVMYTAFAAAEAAEADAGQSPKTAGEPVPAEV
jgi:hypothetical protein